MAKRLDILEEKFLNTIKNKIAKPYRINYYVIFYNNLTILLSYFIYHTMV